MFSSWHRQKEVLKTDKATQAESRLAAIKKVSREHQGRWKVPRWTMFGWTFPLDLARHQAKHCPNQIFSKPLRERINNGATVMCGNKNAVTSFPSLTLALARRGMKGSGISEMSFRSSKPLLSMSRSEWF